MAVRRGRAPRRAALRPAAAALAVVALAGAAACGAGRTTTEDEPAEDPAPLPDREPVVRVGIDLGRDSIGLSESEGLRVAPAGAREPLPGSGRPGGWTFRAVPGGVEASGPADDPAADGSGEPPAERTFRRLRIRPDEGATIGLGGRTYRGEIELYRVDGHGLVAVNRLDLETYLLGVVPVEIGRRSEEEVEAVKAQAVAARTYAVRNLGRRDSLGFDVFGNVEDQVYAGRGVEREDATRAVRATAGEVLAWRGRPVRAYYHSTGGGTTARVTDVWNLPDAPYLDRVSDRRPEGGHYCDISPRYTWTESWTGPELRDAVEAGIRRHFGMDVSVEEVRSVRVLGRVAGGRVDRLEIRTDGGAWVVAKNDIRFFLRTSDDRILRSTRFDVAAGPDGEGRLELRGRGFGHGVGMCQWGAIGRARRGHGYPAILEHYYPGTELVEAY